MRVLCVFSSVFFIYLAMHCQYYCCDPNEIAVCNQFHEWLCSKLCDRKLNAKIYAYNTYNMGLGDVTIRLFTLRRTCCCLRRMIGNSNSSCVVLDKFLFWFSSFFSIGFWWDYIKIIRNHMCLVRVRVIAFKYAMMSMLSISIAYVKSDFMGSPSQKQLNKKKSRKH